ncbi:hypothetical protein BGZ57DRAFT_858684 [Hyaloscypha finlandica]|nr:hypothetical protein BGZ57DRAFT_858684 [Hyaloscypha finlandica]
MRPFILHAISPIFRKSKKFLVCRLYFPASAALLLECRRPRAWQTIARLGKQLSDEITMFFVWLDVRRLHVLYLSSRNAILKHGTRQGAPRHLAYYRKVLNGETPEQSIAQRRWYKMKFNTEAPLRH